MRRWPVDEDMSQGVVKAVKSELAQTGRAALQFGMQRTQTCSIESVWRERERERERGRVLFVGFTNNFALLFLLALPGWLCVCVRLAAVSLTLSLRHPISLLTTYKRFGVHRKTTQHRIESDHSLLIRTVDLSSTTIHATHEIGRGLIKRHPLSA